MGLGHPLSNQGACPAEGYSRIPQLKNRAAFGGQLFRTVHMLTSERSLRTETSRGWLYHGADCIAVRFRSKDDESMFPHDEQEKMWWT